MDQRSEQAFLKDDIKMANKYMKSCSTSLVIREMQINIRMIYHFKPTKMAIVKKSETKYWQDVEEQKCSCIAGSLCKSCRSTGKQPGSSSELNIELYRTQEVHARLYSQEKWKHICTQKLVHEGLQHHY